MGMNPETHRFEELVDEPALRAAYGKGWKIFAIGEKVTLKETDFSVIDIQPAKLVLRPYGTDTLTAQKAESVAAQIAELEATTARPPHQQRVLDELGETRSFLHQTRERSTRLNAFFGTSTFKALPEGEKERLFRQHAIMGTAMFALTELVLVLEARIANFPA